VTTFDEQASQCLEAVLRGRDRENARHRLIELGLNVIPLVTMYFQRDRESATRSTLVNIAWQIDPSAALPLLKDALDDSEPGVWKEALDGLTVLGGRAALDVMRDARGGADAEKAEWLDEAIEQVTGGMTDSERQNDEADN
jgi:hypothetical protein